MAKNEAECLKMVADEVKGVRTKYKPTLTQEGLGKKIGKHKQSISDIECERYYASMETLVDIAKATKTNLIIEFKTDEELKADKELKELIRKTK